MVSPTDPVNQGNETPEEDAQTDRLRDRIEQTRAEMDETMDELGQPLQPRHLLDEVLGFLGDGARGASDSVKEAAGKACSATWRQIKAHPVPAIAAGAGVAWLVYSMAASKNRPDNIPDESGTYGGSYVDARTGEPYDKASYGHDIDLSSEAAAASEPQQVQAIEEGACDMTGSTHGKSSSRRGRAASVASSARDGMRRAATSLRHGAAVAGEKVQDGFVKGREKVEEYPLAAGMAALGIGLLVGLMLPPTAKEREVMGQASFTARRRARAAGAEMLERGKDAMQRSATAFKECAEREGLTAEAIGDKVQQAAVDAADAATHPRTEQA